jgi:hypothetical protein
LLCAGSVSAYANSDRAKTPEGGRFSAAAHSRSTLPVRRIGIRLREFRSRENP